MLHEIKNLTKTLKFATTFLAKLTWSSEMQSTKPIFVAREKSGDSLELDFNLVDHFRQFVMGFDFKNSILNTF